MLSFCWRLWPVQGVAAPLRGQRSRFGDLSSGLEDLSGNEPSVCHWGGVLCYPAGVIQDSHLWRGWGLGRPHVAWQSRSSVVGLRLGPLHAADAGEAFLSWISLEEGWWGLAGQGRKWNPPLSDRDSSSVLYLCVHAKLIQSCPTLRNPMDYNPPGSSVLGDSSGRNTGVGYHFLLQGIFLTQELNSFLPHCRWILYHWATWETHIFLTVWYIVKNLCFEIVSWGLVLHTLHFPLSFPLLSSPFLSLPFYVFAFFLSLSLSFFLICAFGTCLG